MLETLTMEVRNEMELVGDHPLVSDSEREAGGTLIFSLEVDDESSPPLGLETLELKVTPGPLVVFPERSDNSDSQTRDWDFQKSRTQQITNS